MVERRGRPTLDAEMHATHEPIPFHPPDLQTLANLARGARVWGALSLGAGAVTLALFAVAIPRIAGLQGPLIAGPIAIASFALVVVLCGLRYIAAARELANVRVTGRDAVEHTVRAFERLGGAFKLEAIVTGMSIALGFAVGAVWAALRVV